MYKFHHIHDESYLPFPIYTELLGSICLYNAIVYLEEGALNKLLFLLFDYQLNVMNWYKNTIIRNKQ